MHFYFVDIVVVTKYYLSRIGFLAVFSQIFGKPLPKQTSSIGGDTLYLYNILIFNILYNINNINI